MTRKLAAALFAVVLTAAAAGAIAGASGGAAEGKAAAGQRQPVRYEVRDLFIETNATDGDAGLQLRLDGEDWLGLSVHDPRGRPMVDVKARGRLRRYGLTELFFEAAEPSFDESPFRVFKRRFPEGRYTFRGRTVEGRGLAGSDRLTHIVPAGPDVTFPTTGAQVDPNGFAVTWQAVTRPAGVDIVRYIVIVTQGARELSMDLGPGATSASIPGEFLAPGTETEVEVLAREKSGNQTITAVEFRTR
jgi:hypothetical protein